MLSTEGEFCIIIGYVHQFMGHCLIPLDPCIELQVYRETKERNLRQDMIKFQDIYMGSGAFIVC